MMIWGLSFQTSKPKIWEVLSPNQTHPPDKKSRIKGGLRLFCTDSFLM